LPSILFTTSSRCIPHASSPFAPVLFDCLSHPSHHYSRPLQFKNMLFPCSTCSCYPHLTSSQVTCGVDGRVKLWMLTSASSVAAASAGASSPPHTVAEVSGSKLDGMVSMNSNFTDSL
jgi:hypothetical protein